MATRMKCPSTGTIVTIAEDKVSKYKAFGWPVISPDSKSATATSATKAAKATAAAK